MVLRSLYLCPVSRFTRQRGITCPDHFQARKKPLQRCDHCLPHAPLQIHTGGKRDLFSLICRQIAVLSAKSVRCYCFSLMREFSCGFFKIVIKEHNLQMWVICEHYWVLTNAHSKIHKNHYPLIHRPFR